MENLPETVCAVNKPSLKRKDGAHVPTQNYDWHNVWCKTASTRTSTCSRRSILYTWLVSGVARRKATSLSRRFQNQGEKASTLRDVCRARSLNRLEKQLTLHAFCAEPRKRKMIGGGGEGCGHPLLLIVEARTHTPEQAREQAQQARRGSAHALHEKTNPSVFRTPKAALLSTFLPPPYAVFCCTLCGVLLKAFQPQALTLSVAADGFGGSLLRALGYSLASTLGKVLLVVQLRA